MALSSYLNIDMVIRVPTDRSKVSLVILDNEYIDDGEERDRLLQLKLGAYLEAIASGQLAKANPSIEGLSPMIEVVYYYPPTQHMLDIERIRQRKPPHVELAVKAISLEDFGARYNVPSDELQALKARAVDTDNGH